MTRAELVEAMARAIWEKRGHQWPPRTAFYLTLLEEEATAALAAIEAAGLVCVPREPTREMLSAMYVTPDFCGQHIIRHSVDKLPDAYRAMLAASPLAQEPGR